MIRATIVDTGPLIALLDRRDRHHDWARARFAQTPVPLLTCEPVLAETAHLVRRAGGDAGVVLDIVNRGLLDVSFHIAEHVDRLRRLAHRYRDVPMSLADACIVRLSEIHDGASVLTLDSDFRVYRRNGRSVIPLIGPGPDTGRR